MYQVLKLSLHKYLPFTYLHTFKYLIYMYKNVGKSAYKIITGTCIYFIQILGKWKMKFSSGEEIPRYVLINKCITINIFACTCRYFLIERIWKCMMGNCNPLQLEFRRRNKQRKEREKRVRFYYQFLSMILINNSK